MEVQNQCIVLEVGTARSCADAMDLFSIVTGLFGLAGAITKGFVIVVEFTSDARHATSDLDALLVEDAVGS